MAPISWKILKFKKTLDEPPKIEIIANDGDAGEVLATYYWIHWREFAPDSTLIVKISMYTSEEHMSGLDRIQPDAPDYGLWQWLIKKHEAGELKSDIISNDDLDHFRAEFNLFREV